MADMLPIMSKQPYPSQTQDRFIIRLPDGMRDQIAELAKLNSRSMNAEIVARLAESIRADLGSPKADGDTESYDLIEDVAKRAASMTMLELLTFLEEGGYITRSSKKRAS